MAEKIANLKSKLRETLDVIATLNSEIDSKYKTVCRIEEEIKEATQDLIKSRMQQICKLLEPYEELKYSLDFLGVDCFGKIYVGYAYTDNLATATKLGIPYNPLTLVYVEPMDEIRIIVGLGYAEEEYDNEYLTNEYKKISFADFQRMF